MNEKNMIKNIGKKVFSRKDIFNEVIKECPDFKEPALYLLLRKPKE